MTSFGRISLILIMALTMAIPASMHAKSNKPAVLRMLSSEITGFVRYQDGETPVDQLTIDVWDISREKYLNDWQSFTDEYGHYSIKPLPEGKYYIEYGKIRIELHIIESSNVLVYQPHDIIVVIPEAVALPIRVVPMTVTAGSLINIPFFLYRQKPRSYTPPPPPSVASP